MFVQKKTVGRKIPCGVYVNNSEMNYPERFRQFGTLIAI